MHNAILPAVLLLSLSFGLVARPLLATLPAKGRPSAQRT